MRSWFVSTPRQRMTCWLNRGSHPFLLQIVGTDLIGGARRKLIHAAVATPANVDSTVLPDLLHGNETRRWCDQAYRGQRGVIRQDVL